MAIFSISKKRKKAYKDEKQIDSFFSSSQNSKNKKKYKAQATARGEYRIYPPWTAICRAPHFVCGGDIWLQYLKELKPIIGAMNIAFTRRGWSFAALDCILRRDDLVL